MPFPIFHTAYLDWDADAILDAAGSPAALRDLLKAHGLPVPAAETVYMWRTRGSIPGRWAPSVIYVLLKEKRVTSLGSLMRRRKSAA